MALDQGKGQQNILGVQHLCLLFHMNGMLIPAVCAPLVFPWCHLFRFNNLPGVCSSRDSSVPRCPTDRLQSLQSAVKRGSADTFWTASFYHIKSICESELSLCVCLCVCVSWDGVVTRITWWLPAEIPLL